VPSPFARSCSAAAVTSPMVRISRPVASANSCAFGFTKCGVAMSAARSINPEVSSATRRPAVRAARAASTMWRSENPFGRVPQIASQSAELHESSVVRTSSSTSSEVRVGPDSLILLLVPSASTIETLVRMVPVMVTARYGKPAVSSNWTSCCPAGPPIGSTASTGTPWRCSARATLMPLPLGSASVAVHRLTAPRVKVSRNSVRSRLGLGVSVTIMQTPLDLERPHPM
jgi:hypothetical protein